MIHITENKLPGKQMKHTAEKLQLYIGIGEYFMHTPFRKYGKYATETWMTFLWKEIFRLPISITHWKSPTLTLQREPNDYIMDILVKLDMYNTTQLKSVISTRTFYQYHTLANILTGT